MGSALARALLAQGHRVTVWNRTPARAEPLREAGATTSAGLVDAIASGEVAIMCVADQAAVRELLSDAAVWEALRGKTLVQLTTGTPADGRRNQTSASEQAIDCLVGAIMAYPRTIGTDAAVLLYSGPRAAFEAWEELLIALGTTRYVGEDAGRPAAIDAGLIAFFYGTLAGFMHGATLARSEGIEMADYLELARPWFTSFITEAVQETADRVVAGNYADAQSSMHTHLGGIDLLVVATSREAGIDHEVMVAIRDWFASAIAAGRGDDDIAVLAELTGAAER
jgi:3-hydroxyisobutyrate dehydrogenase-like beta-hydroxyacid dehydrogenase